MGRFAPFLQILNICLILKQAFATYNPQPAKVCTAAGFYDLVFEQTYDVHDEAFVSCKDFTLGPTSVRTCGYTKTGDLTALYNRYIGPNENGLGITAGIDRQISNGFIVSIDATQLSSQLFITMTSVSGGDTYQIYGSQSQYSPTNKLEQSTLLVTSSQTSQLALQTGYKYYFVTVIGSGNVLINKVSIRCNPSPVPPPVAAPVGIPPPPVRAPVYVPPPVPAPVYVPPPVSPPSLSPTAAPVYIPITPNLPACYLDWNIRAATGALQNCATFNVFGYNYPITICGYTRSGTPTALNGAVSPQQNMNGLGLVSDPSGKGEIWSGGFIQLDLSQLSPYSQNPRGLQIAMAGIQGNDRYSFYGSNIPGSIGSDLLYSGNSQINFFNMPGYGSYRYVSIVASAGSVLLYQIISLCPLPTQSPTPGPTAAPVTIPVPAPTPYPTSAPTRKSCLIKKFTFQDVLGSPGREYKYLDIYGSGQKLPTFGWTALALQTELFDTGYGVGIAKGANNMITSDFYVQFYIFQYLGEVSIYNVIGNGIIRIYGSNLWGGVIGKFGQYLLYEGPPTAYRYERLGEFQYISVTAVTGYCQVESVTIEITTHMFDMTDLIGSTDNVHNYYSTDGVGLQLPVYGWTALALQTNLAGTGLGLGVFETGVINGYQIGVGHYVQFDLNAYLGVYAKFDIIGTGEIQIYGSNLWGGAIGGYGQYLLYQGPAGSYTYTGYATYRYISVHTVRGYAQVTKVWVGCPPVVRPYIPLPTCNHQFDFNDIRGLINNDYKFLANDFSGQILKVYGWHSLAYGVPLVGTGIGLGLNLQLPGTVFKFGAAINFQVDSKRYIQFDFDAYIGSSIVLNIAADVNTIIQIYNSPLLGGVIGQFQQYLIYTGPATQYVYTGTHRYVSVTAQIGSFLINSVNVGCAVPLVNIRQVLHLPTVATRSFVIPQRTAYLPTCSSYFFNFQDRLGKTQLYSYNYVSVGVSGLVLPVFGWHAQAYGLALISSNLGLGIDSGSGWVTNNQYIQFDLSQYLGTLIDFEIVGTGDIQIYGSPLLGGVIGQFQQYLLYQGPPTVYTYARLGEFQYVSITATAGATLMIKSVSVKVSNHHFDMSDILAETSATHTYLATSNVGLTLPVYGWTALALQTNLYANLGGLGVSLATSILGLGRAINSDAYVQFDLKLYLAVNVKFNLIGNGYVKIYGSNLWGGVIGAFGQYLLYQGPVTSYRYTGLGTYRYISITTTSGTAVVASVDVGC